MASRKRKYRYNIITTQQGRRPIWTPDEALRMLDAVEEGDLTVLSDDLERVIRYINDRYDQLTKDFGFTETSCIPLMAAAINKTNREARDFRGYILYVKEHMEAGKPYIMPDEWQKLSGDE